MMRQEDDTTWGTCYGCGGTRTLSKGQCETCTADSRAVRDETYTRLQAAKSEIAWYVAAIFRDSPDIAEHHVAHLRTLTARMEELFEQSQRLMGASA